MSLDQAFRQFQYPTVPLHVDEEARNDAIAGLDKLLSEGQ